MIAALVALALAGASPTQRESTAPLEVLEAGEAEYDVARERGRASGGVVLRRGVVMLRAGAATYDKITGEVEATGGVLLLEPGRAVAASAMHAVLDGPFEAHDVVAFLKDAPLDLSRCRSVDDVRAARHGRIEVGGALAHGESGAAGGRFQVDRARLTLCDCGTGAPSWEIRAHHADVVPGKRAFLTWPVIYITPRFLLIHRPVPVMLLPVLYLPLADRQSGLLIPAIDFGGISGFSISEPLFLALGRSWDATITPSYSFGPGASTVAAQQRGMKGPGVELELRWAPAEDAHGVFRLFERKSEVDNWPVGVARPAGMNRLALSFGHDQRFSDRTYLKAEAALVGDPFYVFDFNGDALLRATDYRRSAVALERRSEDALLEADAAYHLPLNPGFLGSGTAQAAPFGFFGGGLDTFHRLPAASATLLPIRLGGPLTLAASAGVARYAPLRGPTGDEGLDQIGPGERGWTPPAVRDAGEDDGHWQRGERLAATRALARAELRAPFTVGGAFLLEPWAAGTAAGYSFEAGQGTQADARAAGGVTLSTALTRTYGQGAGRLTHVIEPSVALRAGTAQAGPALPAFAYDELDLALSPPVPGATAVVPQRTLTAAPGAFQQVRLAVRNRLVAPGRASAELTVGLDADLGRERPSETWAQGTLQLGPLNANAAARFYAFGAGRPAGTPAPQVASALDRFTELRAGLSLADGRGEDVHASLTAIGPGGSPRLLAGIEPFFDPRPTAVDATAAGGLGARAKLSGATIAYDAGFNARPFAAPLCAGKSKAPHIYQHSASLVWDSPCRCWKAGITALLSECDAAPRFGFVIDLSSIAQRRTGF